MRYWIAAALLLSMTTAQAGKPLDCTRTLTGNWVGADKIDMMGGVELDNRLELRADGTFTSDYRYRSVDRPWREQVQRGQWKAKGSGASCNVTMTVSTDGGQGTSESEYKIVDKNTILVSELKMRRVQEGQRLPQRPALVLQSTDCKTPLIGRWSGQGTTAGLIPAQVSTQLEFRSDGTYLQTAEGRLELKGSESKRSRSEGRWSAVPTTSADVCEVTMQAAQEDAGGWPADPNYFRLVNANTLSSAGVRLTRSK